MKILFCAKDKKETAAGEQQKQIHAEPRFGKDLQPIQSKDTMMV